MANKDLLKANFRTQLASAMQAQNEDAVVEAFMSYADALAEEIRADAAVYRTTHDEQILARRGVRVLTSEERDWYQRAIDAMRSADPRSAVANIVDAIPATVIADVLGNITTEFPLLDAVDFVDTGAMTKVVTNATARQKAVWGALNAAISAELSGSVNVIDVTHNKLFAYMFVSQDMLAEGPEWTDAYVRRILIEAIGYGLCDGIINGNGLTQPVGMIKDLTAAIDPTTGYATQEATALDSLSPKDYGEVVATLATDGTGRERAIDGLVFICNPVDYFTLVAPATTYLTEVGAYVHDVFPFPTKVIQDANVPSKHAIVGIGKLYHVYAGVGKDGGKLEFSDDFKFTDDLRTYKIKLYANGRAEANAFAYVDITSLAPLQGA